MATFGSNLKEARKRKKLTQRQLADAINAKHNSVSNWENDQNKPDPDTIELICGVLDISPNVLFGTGTQHVSSLPNHPNILPISTRRVPILGDVACGEPIFAQEDFSSYTLVGSDVDCDFALRCKGDSMIGARIFDGDVVFVRKQDYVDDGSIAVVLLDDDATLKRVYHTADGRIELKAENPMYRPIIVGGEDETRTFRILGKAIAFQSIVV